MSRSTAHIASFSRDQRAAAGVVVSHRVTRQPGGRRPARIRCGYPGFSRSAARKSPHAGTRAA